MPQILIVEDEAKIARFLELELAHEGYEVATAADGRAGVEAALGHDFDLVLLDVLLPQLNGLEVLRRLRREKATPVIMLTARDAVVDKVAGLDAGADDYITKPFAIEELLARIRVALKHADERRPEQDGPEAAAPRRLLTAGPLALDLDGHTVAVDGAPVELTNREFEVLRVLLENRGRVLSRDQIAQHACGYDFVGETNIVDVYVRHLRAKIDDRFGVKVVTTVRGAGYVVR